MFISSRCPWCSLSTSVLTTNIFWPHQDKVQVPQKGQSDNRAAPGCSSSPSEAQAALVALWRCFRKYPINRLPHWDPTLSWEQEIHPKKPLILQWCPMLGVGLSRHGWAQGITAVGRDEPVEKNFFYYYFFFLSFSSSFFFFYFIHDGWTQQERQSSLETDLSAAK